MSLAGKRAAALLAGLAGQFLGAAAWAQAEPSGAARGAAGRNAVGARGPMGCREGPKVLEWLEITQPGVYENLLVDGKWAERTLVKVLADGVTLRRCEIRNSRGNGIVVLGRNVTIESTRIHHLLRGTFAAPLDAHGITGAPSGLVVRDCEIYLVSGDAVQFDPGRRPWGGVLIENSTFWTGPLEADAAGFRKGESPGENAVDTKQQARNPRSDLVLRNCLFSGWEKGAIDNQAALNLKDHVQVTVEGCVLHDNEVGFRLRGGRGERGGALVAIRDCAVYRALVAVRAEEAARDLKIHGLRCGEGVKRKYKVVGRWGPGHENLREGYAPPLEQAIREGLVQKVER